MTYAAYVDGVLNRAFEAKEEERSPSPKLADAPKTSTLSVDVYDDAVTRPRQNHVHFAKHPVDDSLDVEDVAFGVCNKAKDMKNPTTKKAISFPCFPMKREEEDDEEENRSPLAMSDDEDEEDSGQFKRTELIGRAATDSELEKRRISTISTEPRSATDSEVTSRSISVERFRGIMSKHSKRYPTEDIINDLQDDNGHIPLYSIASCNKRYKTLDEVDED